MSLGFQRWRLSMPGADRRTTTYREIAECYDRSGQDTLRDRFLVLAADAAFGAHRIDEAERLRGHLLERNPHHLLKPYASFEEAMKTVDVQTYVAALRQSHPFERAEQLLKTLRPASPELPDDAKIIPLSASEEAVHHASIYPLRPPLSFNGPSPAAQSNPSIRARTKPTPGRADNESDIYRIRPEPDLRGRWANTTQGEAESRWSVDAIVSSFLLMLVIIGSVSLAVYAF